LGNIILATVFGIINSESGNVGFVNPRDNGPSFYECREMSKGIGCVETLMLDGGFSTQISYTANGVFRAIVSRDGEYIRDPVCRIRVNSESVIELG
jgi:hypothetical protein